MRGRRTPEEEELPLEAESSALLRTITACATLRLLSRKHVAAASLLETYHRLIEWVDRPAILIRLAITVAASWAIFFVQVSTLDYVPPDYIDKGIHSLQAFGHALSMDTFRSVFPWLVAAQIAGVVLIALRIMPLVWVPLVLVPLFWPSLLRVSYPLGVLH